MSVHTLLVLARTTASGSSHWELKGPFPEFFNLDTVIADLSANPRYDVVAVVHGIHIEKLVQMLEDDARLNKLSAPLCIMEMHKAGLFAMPKSISAENAADYEEFGESFDGHEDDDDEDLPPFISF